MFIPAPVLPVSVTSPDPGNGGTVATAGLGVSRITPAANETGGILATGAVNGQQIFVENESATHTLAWATQATSNIGAEAGGTFVLNADEGQMFVWDSVLSLWIKAT